MKTVLGFVACSVVIAACADQAPAKDPSTATTTSSSSARTESYPSSTSVNAPVQSKTTPMDGSSASASDTPSPRLMDTSGSDAFADRGSPTTAGSTASTAPTTNDGKNVDNTKNNERDRHGTLTPGNQGNSKSETQITADVRKGLMSSKSLSFTAKNAKIITVGSKVTLRGVVKTDAEKAEIESVAKGTNGVTDVDNQLEVKK